MVEHCRHRRGHHLILDRRDQRERSVELDMPAACLDAIDRGLKSLFCDIWIVDATSREIEPDSAKTLLLHGIEVALRSLVVDDGDPAGGRPRALMPNSVA